MTKVDMNYHCPLKTSSMKSTDKGHFCDQCKETVIDYTKMNNTSFQRAIEQNKGKYACGSFLPSQVQTTSTGDFRDRLISFYHRQKSNTSSFFSRQRLLLGVASALVFLTGCHRKCHNPGPVGFWSARVVHEKSINEKTTQGKKSAPIQNIETKIWGEENLHKDE